MTTVLHSIKAPASGGFEVAAGSTNRVIDLRGAQAADMFAPCFDDFPFTGPVAFPGRTIDWDARQQIH